MTWKVAEAKQRLSELLRQAQNEPQVILNRDRVVAVVLGAADAAHLEEWKAQKAGAGLASRLSEISRICRDTGYTFKTPRRRNRRVAFAWPDASR